MKKKIKKLKNKSEFYNALILYYKDFYSTFSVLRLQKEMLHKGICPRCGALSHHYSSRTGHFPCSNCNFNISPKELELVLDDYGNVSILTQKRILNRRLKIK